MADQEERPPTTLPANAVINIRGWLDDDEGAAREFGNRLMAFTNECSRYFDLTLLTKIVVSWDYPSSLAEITQTDNQPAAVPTANEFGQGGAMAVWRKDGEELTSALVVYGPLITAMFDEESLEQRLAEQTYLHELVHIDDQNFMQRTFPGGAIAAEARDARHSALLKIVDGAVNEYSATRRTATIEPTTGLHFLDMLDQVLRHLDDEMLEKRKQYQREIISLDEFWVWASERIRFLFQSLGYALGHVDGLHISEGVAEDIIAQHDEKLTALRQHDFGWLIDEVRDGILPVFEQSAWESLDVLDPLAATAEKMLDKFGLYLSVSDEQLWIDIPFRGMIDL